MKYRRIFAGSLACALLFAASAFADSPVSTANLTIRMGYQPLTPTWGISIIYQAKLWKKYLPNVEVDRVNFMSGMPLVNTLVAAKLDMGYLGDMPIIVLASKGALQQTKFLAVTDADEGGASEIYVAKDSPIKTIKDLNGKRVSIPFGGYSHRFAEVLAAIEGINFEFVGQSPEVGLTNLQAGKVDAYIPWPPYGELAVHKGFARKLADGTKYHFDALRGVVVTKEFADQHPDVVVGWLRAELDAHKIMRERPDYAAQLLYKEWSAYGIPLPVISEEFSYKVFPDEITPQWRKVLTEGADFLRSHKFITGDINFDTYIDDSYLKKAAAIPTQLDLAAVPKQ